MTVAHSIPLANGLSAPKNSLIIGYSWNSPDAWIHELDR